MVFLYGLSYAWHLGETEEQPFCLVVPILRQGPRGYDLRGLQDMMLRLSAPVHPRVEPLGTPWWLSLPAARDRFASEPSAPRRALFANSPDRPAAISHDQRYDRDRDRDYGWD